MGRIPTEIQKWTGPLDFVTVPQLSQQARALIQQHPKLVFELSKVTHSDNAGLGLLVDLARYAKTQDHWVTFAEAPPQLRNLATAMGVAHLLPWN